MKLGLIFFSGLTIATLVGAGCSQHNSDIAPDVYTPQLTGPTAAHADAAIAPARPNVSVGGDFDTAKPATPEKAAPDVAVPTPAPVPAPASAPVLKADASAPSVKQPAAPSVGEALEPSVKPEVPSVKLPTTQPSVDKTETPAKSHAQNSVPGPNVQDLNK